MTLKWTMTLKFRLLSTGYSSCSLCMESARLELLCPFQWYVSIVLDKKSPKLLTNAQMYFSSKVLWIQSSLYMSQSHFLTHAFTMCYKHMARWQCMTRMNKVWCKKKKILPRTLRSCLALYLLLSKSDVFWSIHFLDVYLKRLLFLHLTEM